MTAADADRLLAEYQALVASEPRPGTESHVVWMNEMERFGDRSPEHGALFDAIIESHEATIQ
jgi:hypothetical protein